MTDCKTVTNKCEAIETSFRGIETVNQTAYEFYLFYLF